MWSPTEVNLRLTKLAFILAALAAPAVSPAAEICPASQICLSACYIPHCSSFTGPLRNDILSGPTRYAISHGDCDLRTGSVHSGCSEVGYPSPCAAARAFVDAVDDFTVIGPPPGTLVGFTVVLRF